MIGLIFGDTDFPNQILKTIKKKKIKYLIIDLFAILFMISIFEYIFFSCIVSNIRPISPYELLNNIINNLQNYIEN